jgi:hypothetical protein
VNFFSDQSQTWKEEGNELGRCWTGSWFFYRMDCILYESLKTKTAWKGEGQVAAKRSM